MKGFGRLMACDFIQQPDAPEFQGDACAPFKNGSFVLENSMDDRDFEMAMRIAGADLWRERVEPCCALNRAIGNCYTGSVFGCLVATICHAGAQLKDRRVLLFSYGSGSMASMYSLRGRVPGASSPGPFSLTKMAQVLSMQSRLNSRCRGSVEDFAAALDLRAAKYGTAPVQPDGSLENIAPGTYYVVDINERHHRSYQRK